MEFPNDTATVEIEQRLNAAYAEVEDERHRQRPPRGHYAYLRRDGTVGFARCTQIKNAGATLNQQVAEKHVMQQLPSDGYA